MHLIVQRFAAAGAVFVEKIASSGPPAAVAAALAIVEINGKGQVNDKHTGSDQLITRGDEGKADQNHYHGRNNG
jgi:hypothetical protein